MKRNKKYLITGRDFQSTIEIKFNSNEGNIFMGESEGRAQEIFKKVLKGITQINFNISIKEI
jgi:hypothetical protein